MQLISKQEARGLGLNRFFMGVECRHGHVADRYTLNGACVACTRKYTAIAPSQLPPAKNKRAKKSYAKNPEKAIARALARRARDDGRIARQPCACGSAERLQMHHDDYSRPLDVIWLCQPCHVALHHPQAKR